MRIGTWDVRVGVANRRAFNVVGVAWERCVNGYVFRFGIARVLILYFAFYWNAWTCTPNEPQPQ